MDEKNLSSGEDGGRVAISRCSKCGGPLSPGAVTCPKCGTPTSSSSPRPALTDRVGPRSAGARKLLLVALAPILAVVVVLAVLYLVPFPERVTVRSQFTSIAGGPSGCGRNVAGLHLTPGESVHFSWYTTPVTSVNLTVSPLSGSPVVYNQTGTSGDGVFSTTTSSYLVVVTNCGSQVTTVTVSAYYNSQAPIL